ncbi:MAG: ribonuclease J [Patescibacteria group bacterium]
MNEVKQVNFPQGSVSFLSLGGEEEVTRNMYLYEYNNQILIVDCGLGFPDETMLGVDLLLPDISPLQERLKAGKKIVGMLFTHGHEDHIGGLPFILPQLLTADKKIPFPLYASPLTTALANEKLAEFQLPRAINIVNFGDKEIRLGDFTISFIRVTHSVPDSANIFIKTPVGNFFHGSDYKFDLTPADGKRTEFHKILEASQAGVLALMSDCLGAHKSGHTPSEQTLGKNFADEMRDCPGKFILTTYSSNISRVNQVVEAAEKMGRKVCFVGRSVIKVKEIGQQLGYLHIKSDTEISIDAVKNYPGNKIVLLVAGSQGQENSALSRIANGEHREIKLEKGDVVVFSSDVIPGNEIAVNTLLDTLVKRGARIARSELTGTFHVSGHGSSGDHMLLIALAQPKFLLPISGTYRDMVAYREFSGQMGYKPNEIALVENGQEMIFTPTSMRPGKRVTVRNIYVDEVSGEAVEHFVVRDRERLSREGIVVILAEIKTEDGQLAAKPEIILRGSSLGDVQGFSGALVQELEQVLSRKKEQVTNWTHIRRLIAETAGKHLARKFRTRPLLLPVVIEV